MSSSIMLPLIKPPVRVCARRKGGQGQQDLHPSAGPVGLAFLSFESGSGNPSIKFWVSDDQVWVLPLPDLVGNTDEGGGARRAA